MTQIYLTVEALTGKGKSFILLHERQEYQEFASHVAETLAAKAQVLHVTCNEITNTNWSEITAELQAVTQAHAIKAFSFLTFGATSVIAEAATLRAPRTVRSLLMVDPTIRAHPSTYMKLLDRVEGFLPLGLPFRSTLKGFDGKALLHRIRCPTFLMVTPTCSAFVRQQSEQIAEMIPTAWFKELPAEDAIKTLSESALNFIDVPARCPQKNIARSSQVITS